MHNQESPAKAAIGLLRQIAPKSWQILNEQPNEIVLQRKFPINIMYMGAYEDGKDYSYTAEIKVRWDEKWSTFHCLLAERTNKISAEKLQKLNAEYPSRRRRDKASAFRYQKEKQAIMAELKTIPALHLSKHSLIIEDNVSNRVQTTANILENEALVLDEIDALKLAIKQHLQKAD